MSIRIAIADDHPMMIEGLKHILDNYPHISLCGHYLNGSQLMEALKKEVPDVLLLDIQMPGKTGDELAPVILKKYPDLKILTVTNFDSVLYANNMLKKGVHGYLLKTSEEEVLIRAIETVYNGGIFIEQEISQKMQQLETKIEKIVSHKSTLSPREKEVLQLIVDGNTSQEISEKLYLSLHTIENYRDNILIKLEVKNTAALVKKALIMGLVE